MAPAAENRPTEADIPVIDLSQAPGAGEAWNRPKWMIYLWSATELVLVTNPWQVSSKIRTKALRAFGAKIGEGVIIRPRTRIKFPWNLEIGDRSWIGEGVWIHNQDQVTIGHDAVVSQETFITTGSHKLQKDMALVTRPVNIRPGAWLTTRCIVLGGSVVGKSSVVAPGTVVTGEVPANVVVRPRSEFVQKPRFVTEAKEEDE